MQGDTIGSGKSSIGTTKLTGIAAAVYEPEAQTQRAVSAWLPRE
jgi:hypothetical protein